MRILSLAILILVGCTSLTSTNQLDFSFQKAAQLEIGKSTTADIVRIFGRPDETTTERGVETWTYKDRLTNYQRLTVNFKSDSSLESFVWIPLPNESEVRLEKIKEYFPHANFKATVEPNNNPHSISSMISYIDETLGMTILFQKGRNVVEAVVWSDSKRSPATSGDVKNEIYTIDKM